MKLKFKKINSLKVPAIIRNKIKTKLTISLESGKQGLLGKNPYKKVVEPTF